MNATIRRLSGTVGTVVLAGLIWGCGGAASPSPAAASVPAVASTASSAAASEAASTAPSAAPPSSEPSTALPSFALPSEAKDLEALLPGTICGATSTKISQSGQSFAGSSDDDFSKVLAALGKSPTDVSYALSIGADSGCAAGIIRIQGVDTGALQNAFAAAAQQTGDTFVDKNVGGKAVKVQAGDDNPSYFYFRGDAVIFATAKTEADAASILQQLP